ncbi:MAG: asparagine synthetase B family protein, partial [Dehalococcoidia bacterium]
MCGIAGIISHKPIDEAPLQQMIRALGHRGPDDRGVWFAQPETACPVRVGLANTRLAILDLSPAGHQPMDDSAMGSCITYNGEIYNYRELRKELSVRSEELGVRGGESTVGCRASAVSHEGWRSQTDTEVILKAYARWGRESLHYLRGMFAFGIWDAGRQELFLARDPFGIKPLYYYQTNHLFLFASEVRALLTSGLVPQRLSSEGTASYLHCGSVQAPGTIIEGVRSLLPGHYVVAKLQESMLQVEEVPYAKGLCSETPAPPVSDRQEAVVLLRQHLEESVRLHLVSDVPLGVFLSGGIDSSALVALMNQVTDERPKTFSVVFAEGEFSEASHSHLVAEKFGTEHTEIPLSEEELLTRLP